jgi:hypothetical protein
MTNIRRFWGVMGVCLLICCGSGCVPQKTLTNAYLDPVANPTTGPAVVVVKVTDLRTFEADPTEAETPTLKGSGESPDRADMSRAIGRAGPANGLTWFYYHYPQELTVENVVQTTVENALRAKGYIVVAKDSKSAANAIPVEVGIRKFWLSTFSSAWYAKLQYEVEVDVKSPVVPEWIGSVAGNSSVTIFRLENPVCETCIVAGLNDLATNLQTKLKSPGG